MKKTIFLKACAFAAVALFATSCSEESLDINSGTINIPNVELPAPTASISVTVVDLEAGKIIGGVSTVNATSAIGSTMTVECPANVDYTTAAAIEVAVPSLDKGQSINIPVTFYVTKLSSELAKFMEGAIITSTQVEGTEATYEEISLANAKNEGVWVNGSYENATDEVVAPAFYYNYKKGFEFAEAVESKAAATTILDVIKTAKFETLTGEKSWNIPAWTIFTVKKITQKFFLANMKIENKELEQSVEFIANVAGEVEFEVEEEEIETGHDDHNGNIDHNGNNSHNGHGHGNSNNSGGGIAGNEGE